MFFGFQFLQFIANDSFSYYALVGQRSGSGSSHIRSSERAARLNAVRELFTDLYTTVTFGSPSGSGSPRNETDGEVEADEADGADEQLGRRSSTVANQPDDSSSAGQIGNVPAVQNVVSSALGWAQRVVSNLYN